MRPVVCCCGGNFREGFHSADREATLITQLVSAQAHQKDPDAKERASAEAAQLAATILRLHAQLVKAGLRRDLGR